MKELDRAAKVAVAEVVQSDRRLDQRLIKTSLRPGTFHPQAFPDLVGLKVILPIEKENTGQVTRIEFQRPIHKSILACGTDPKSTKKRSPNSFGDKSTLL